MHDFQTKCLETMAIADRFEGMTSAVSIATFQAFLSYQALKDVKGDFVEFGIYRGRSASVLLNNMRENEHTTLVDVADYPEFEKLSAISDRYKFIRGKSEQLVDTDSFKDSMNGPFRFSHHDASHSFLNVQAEMRFMQDRLAPRGLMVLDDFGNPSFFQVIAACFAHLQRPDNKLSFLLYTNNKGFLCQKEDFPFYEDFIANYLISMINTAGYSQCLSRTERSADYSGFSVYPKKTPETPDLYGVNTYGMRYYTVKSAD